MRRREFIAGPGTRIAGSIQTNAQELPSLAFVGYLDNGPAQGFIFRHVVFREGLAEVDYFEGCNVAIEAHRAELQEWANDLVSRGVAVCFSQSARDPRSGRRQPRRFRLSSVPLRTRSRPASSPASTIRETTLRVSPL